MVFQTAPGSILLLPKGNSDAIVSALSKRLSPYFSPRDQEETGMDWEDLPADDRGEPSRGFERRTGDQSQRRRHHADYGWDDEPDFDEGLWEPDR